MTGFRFAIPIFTPPALVIPRNARARQAVTLVAVPELPGAGRVIISSAGLRFPSAAGERKNTNPFKEEISIMANQKPVSETRIGNIKAAIWRNPTDSGTWHNVTFERIYKDGDNWKSTQSFGRDDLLLLAKVAEAAHTQIFQLQQKEPQSD